jgi:hypothetical protein
VRVAYLCPHRVERVDCHTATGDHITMVLNRVEGTLRFFRDNVDQGIAFREGLRNRRLVPALVVGSSSGGKTTKVTIDSTLKWVPAQVREGLSQSAPQLFV